MMTEYDNTNSGALFRNKKKVSDKHPDYTGNVEVKCPNCKENSEFWLSSWVRKTKRTGEMFMSLALTEREKREPTKDLPQEFDDDEMPF
jgi:phage FluMu protein Com